MTRHTKIVCTLGPATRGEERIEGLVRAGMDVARLNFSHGTHEEHRETLRAVRTVARRLGRQVAVLQDLAGPKIRLGRLPPEGVELVAGDRIDLLPPGVEGEGLPVQYEHLVDDLAPGEPILLADGLVQLEVRGRHSDRVEAEVVVGGCVTSHKGVNLPASDLQVAAFTDKDRNDLEAGLEMGVDLVALSFVRHERDLDEVRSRLRSLIPRPLLVAKIEKPQAVERLDRILDRVDAVMVARGDLGVEMPPEQVPLIQKRIIREARRRAHPVITATQMLRSMVDNPRPLRAEASDVANAVLDGTDAVMLSEETAIGSYPEEAVRMLDRISRAVEPELDHQTMLREPTAAGLPASEAAISRAAAHLAIDLDAAAIVAVTTSGSTARMIARLRPSPPVIGLSQRNEIARQLALSWGVVPVLGPSVGSTDELFRLARSSCLERGYAAEGDRILVTAGLPIATPGVTNLVHVIEV